MSGGADLREHVGVALRCMWRPIVRRRCWRVGSLSLCASGWAGEDWEVEVVDVFESPEVAEAEGIIATPVLVRLCPAPQLSVIGDLGDWREVARVLDLGDRFDE